MNLSTLIVLAVLLALAILAVRYARRRRLLGSCGGDCSSCAAGCAKKR